MPKELKTEAAAPAAPETIKVKVVRQAVNEQGIVHLKGAIFETSPERAAALGELVVPVTAK